MPLYRVTTTLNNTTKTPCNGFYIYSGETYNIDDADYIYGYPYLYPVTQLGYSFDVYYNGTQPYIYIFFEHCDNHVDPAPDSEPKRQGAYQIQLVKLIECEELGPPIPSPNLTPTITPTPTPTPQFFGNYCVDVNEVNGSEQSTQCQQLDYYIDYTFTLKNSSGTTVNAPSNVVVKIKALLSSGGGIGDVEAEYLVTILSGTSTATYRLYTFQTNDSSPACPCPCETTNDVYEITVNNVPGYNITICNNNT